MADDAIDPLQYQKELDSNMFCLSIPGQIRLHIFSEQDKEKSLTSELRLLSSNGSG